MGSIGEFFSKVRSVVLPPPTQHELALKAMAMVAKGAAPRPRRPQMGLHVGQVTEVGETEHRLPPRKGVRLTKKVKVFYQLMVDGSRYPFAHSYGNRHPGWLTRGV